jgi:hypothetical protein
MARILVLHIRCDTGDAPNQMSPAKSVRIGFLYAAIALSGAVYAFVELHQAHRLVHFFKELMPAFIMLVFVLVIYSLLRTAASIFKELKGASQAAQATLYANYGKKK